MVDAILVGNEQCAHEWCARRKQRVDDRARACPHCTKRRALVRLRNNLSVDAEAAICGECSACYAYGGPCPGLPLTHTHGCRQVAACERTTTVVSHEAFSYLARYGLRFEAIAGLSPDAEARLLALTPGKYTGIADQLVDHLK